jgi:hypothetical protein
MSNRTNNSRFGNHDGRLQRFGKLKKIVLALSLFGLATYYIATVPDPFYQQPMEIRALLRNRESVDAYIDRLNVGTVPLRPDGQGYMLPDVLVPYDVRYVRNDVKGSITLSFPFMPVESVPFLVHSSTGALDLPGWKIYKKQHIDGPWWYVRADN